MAKFHKFQENHWTFECPGCECNHWIKTPNWLFNGDVNNPTVSPSILVDKDNPEGRCHFFIKDEKIQYLDDCFHSLKGQTVDLPDWE